MCYWILLPWTEVKRHVKNHVKREQYFSSRFLFFGEEFPEIPARKIHYYIQTMFQVFSLSLSLLKTGKHTIVWLKIWACNLYYHACSTDVVYLPRFSKTYFLVTGDSGYEWSHFNNSLIEIQIILYIYIILCTSQR